MRDTIWASIKTDWHASAVCGGAADHLFFPALETDTALAKVRAMFCDHCPVRAKCLNSALINNDSGFWGGTSTAERQHLKNARHRAKCPLCRSRTLITVNGEATGDGGIVPPYQVCLACGASWRSTSGLHPVKEQPLAEAGSLWP